MRNSIKSVLLFILILLLFSGSGIQAQTASEHYNQGMDFIAKGKFHEAWQSLSQAWQMDKQNYSYRRWFMYISIYMGENALFENNHALALKHFNIAFDIKKELSQTKDTDYITIERYIDLTREHATYCKRPPEYVFKVLALYIKKTDIRNTRDASGNLITSRGEISDNQIANTNHKQNILKFYIEALSRGRLSLSFERKVLNTTLTRATIYARQPHRTVFRPDFDSTIESLGKILFEGRNTFDAIFYYFNNNNFKVWPFANGVSSIYHPYTLYGERRGSIAMPMDVSGEIKSALSRFNHAWVHFHEFFHVIERISGGIGPQHAWLPDAIEKAKQKYPAWVPDMNSAWTATEYTWYRYHFLNTVPAQMLKKAAKSGLYPPFKNFSFVLTRPDRTNQHVFLTYTRALKGISLENLRKASEQMNPAYQLLRKRKTEEAIALYKKALEHNPYHHKALLALGKIYLNQGDTNTAENYFTLFAKVFPDSGELFSLSQSFYKKRDYARAAKFLKIITECPSINPIYLYWLTRVLLEAGDTAGAEPFIQQLKENPLYTAPISYLNFRGRKNLSLNSNSYPEENRTPSLERPRRNNMQKWKIIPSGENGYVLLVSDYNWQCLEVRQSEAGYRIMMGEIQRGDAQKWKLIKDENGVYRIVSKVTGTDLSVIIPTTRNKPRLTILSQEEGSTHSWEISQ